MKPRWDVPAPYGAPAAVEAMGTVAAPLLAGFSLTLLGLVLPSQRLLRWPELALFLLVLAALALLASVQFAFWARQFSAAPGDIEQWWPDVDDEARRLMLRREQWSYAAAYRTYAGRARGAYRLGILSLLLAVTVVLVPDRSIHSIPAGRLAVVALALCGFLFEATWIVAALPDRWIRGRAFRSLRSRVAPGTVPIEPP